MPKNLISNHFDVAGVYVEGQRSAFPFKKPVQSTFMSGMLVPMGDPIPVFPGTKLDLAVNAVLRSNTMVVPPLQGMYIDIFAVWVPHRIVWNEFPQFLGENDSTAWTQSISYQYPTFPYSMINTALSGISVNSSFAKLSLGNLSLLEHYGFHSAPAGISGLSNTNVNALAFRGYYFAWNYLFRDENYQRPVLFSKSSIGSSGEFGYYLRDYYLKSGTTTSILTGNGLFALMPVNKFHDALTSVTPEAQYGDASVLPLGTEAEVVYKGFDTNAEPYFVQADNVTPAVAGNLSTYSTWVRSTTNSAQSAAVGYNPNGSLVADLTNATAATINQFRTAVMYQRYIEALARSGRRVPEFYRAIYGVRKSDALKDYPELLTRGRYVLGVNQVVATADSSGSGWTSHLGDTGAYSLTSIRGHALCEKEFDEFGYLHILYCVRADNVYAYYTPQHFFKKELLEEYNPFFDHTGEVGIKNYLVNYNVSASSVGNWGYQEAWWDERTQVAMQTGAISRSGGSLSYWTLAESMSGSDIVCSPSWLVFKPETLDNIFVSNYYSYPQFIGDFLIYGKKYARMSAHSQPGIVGRI